MLSNAFLTHLISCVPVQLARPCSPFCEACGLGALALCRHTCIYIPCFPMHPPMAPGGALILGPLYFPRPGQFSRLAASTGRQTVVALIMPIDPGRRNGWGGSCRAGRHRPAPRRLLPRPIGERGTGVRRREGGTRRERHRGSAGFLRTD